MGWAQPPWGVQPLQKFLEQRQQVFMKKGKAPPPLVILGGKEGPEGDLVWTADIIGQMLKKEDAELECVLQQWEVCAVGCGQQAAQQ